MANYKGTIIGNGLAESKEKHTPSVHLQIRAELNLDTKEATDRTFYADLWLSERAKERTVSTLRSIGFDGNSIAELNAPSLVGYEIEFSTQFEDYNGNSIERVNFINAVGSYAKRGVKPLDDGITKGLAARYDALFRNSKTPAAKPSINRNAMNQNAQGNAGQKPSAPNYSANVEDDLPF